MIPEAQHPGDPRASAPPFWLAPRELSQADHTARPGARGVSRLGRGGAGPGGGGEPTAPCRRPSWLRVPATHASSLSSESL